MPLTAVAAAWPPFATTPCTCSTRLMPPATGKQPTMPLRARQSRVLLQIRRLPDYSTMLACRAAASEMPLHMLRMLSAKPRRRAPPHAPPSHPDSPGLGIAPKSAQPELPLGKRVDPAALQCARVSPRCDCYASRMAQEQPAVAVVAARNCCAACCQPEACMQSTCRRLDPALTSTKLPLSVGRPLAAAPAH